MNSEKSWPYRKEKLWKVTLVVFLGKNELHTSSEGMSCSSCNPVLVSQTGLAHSLRENPFGHRRHFCLSCYCLPSTRGFHPKIEKAMCCHTTPLQQSFQTSLSGGSGEHVGLWSGIHWGTGMFSEALGWTTGGQGRQVEAPVCHPVPKLVPAHLLELCKATVVLPTGLFFCVSNNWCHSQTVKKIKQAAYGSWETYTFCSTKERFVFLPSIIPHIQTRERKNLRTISKQWKWTMAAYNIKETRMVTILFSDMVRDSSAYKLCTVLMWIRLFWIHFYLVSHPFLP